jgi:hypothetical protein
MRLSRVIFPVLLFAALCVAANAQKAPARTTWNGREAYLLTNGKMEAIVVPSLSSRLMAYRFVGGKNALWNLPPGTKLKPGDYVNWGGEKVWPAPHTDWELFWKVWPPHPTYDILPHSAQILPGGRLRTVGPVMEGWGVRATREFFFDRATGDLVIATTFKKEKGEPRFVAAWNLVQAPQPDVIYIPVNTDSLYRDSAYWFGGKMPKEANKTEVGPDGLLAYRPTPTGAYKFGTDAPVAAAAGVRGDTALILRSTKKTGQYPEGADGAGFPITVWNAGSDKAPERYSEIEVMSPLTNLRKGGSLTHVLRLRLIRLPSADPTSRECRAAVAAALR